MEKAKSIILDHPIYLLRKEIVITRTFGLYFNYKVERCSSITSNIIKTHHQKKKPSTINTFCSQKSAFIMFTVYFRAEHNIKIIEICPKGQRKGLSGQKNKNWRKINWRPFMCYFGVFYGKILY